jgi:hypothetical protein
VVCDPGHGPVIEDLWKLNFGDAGHPCAAACCLYIAPRVNRFRTVFDPFMDRLRTVSHGFSPFLPFLKNGQDDELRASKGDSLVRRSAPA